MALFFNVDEFGNAIALGFSIGSDFSVPDAYKNGLVGPPIAASTYFETKWNLAGPYFAYSRTTIYLGAELTYNGSTLTGGEITLLYEKNVSELQFRGESELFISGGRYDAVTVQGFLTTGDEEGFWSYLAAGDDVFVASDGADRVRGGGGSDVIFVDGIGNKTIYGGSGSNAVYSGAGDDTIIAGNLTAIALVTNDWSTAYGGAGNDAVLAGYGSNGVMYGGDGHDYLIDGTGTDLIYGGAGFDYIAAGTGANYLMFDGTSIVGGEYDTVDYFNASAATYIGFAAAYQPYVSFAQLDGTVQISTPTGDGQYYSIFVLSASVADVQARLFYF